MNKNKKDLMDKLFNGNKFVDDYIDFENIKKEDDNKDE